MSGEAAIFSAVAAGIGLAILFRARAARASRSSSARPPADPAGADRPGRWFSWRELGDPPEELRANAIRLCREALDPLRDAWGGPLDCISGWRSEVMNLAAGGAPSSQHLRALAADLRPWPRGEESARALHALADAMQRDGRIPPGGLGLYLRGDSSFVHVDIRGRLARWSDRREA